MSIKLQSLVSELDLDTSGFKKGADVVKILSASLALAISAVTGAIAVSVNATFKWAKELDSLQDIMGVTSKQAAALNFVLRKSGTDTDTFTKGMTILEKGLTKTDGTLDVTGKRLKDYGINVLSANGKVKDQADLFSTIADRYAKFSTQQERVNFLTDVFGKSGAELVDVFDTLAQEGGIDKVSQKVQDLGLVIDPQRYENFTRSLEELKLMFLGVEIGITEKVMPSLEKFVGILTGNGSIQDKIKELVGVFIGKDAENFITPWLNKLTDFGTYIQTNIPIWTTDFKDFVKTVESDYNDKFIPAVSNGKLSLVEFYDKVLLLQQAEKDGKDVNYQYAKSISDLAAIDIVKAIDLGGILKSTFNDLVTVISLLTGETDKESIKLGILNGLIIGIGTPVLQASQWISDLGKAFKWLDDRLQDVINHWQNVKELAGFFNPFKPIANSLPSAGGNGGSSPNRRASGGSVIAGQAYQVSEFYKPEMFTPNQSGRIDQMQSQSIDEEKIGDAMARRLLRDLPPMLQLLKA